MHDPTKQELRSRLRESRRLLPEEISRRAARAAARFAAQLPGWDTAKRIALYLPADGELGTGDIANDCRGLGKQLFLPVITSAGSLEFAHWRTDAQLQPNRFGIPEPPADADRIPAGELDILFMPLVAWDRRGARLGMGGGYYDRALEGTRKPLLAGLAHAIQEVNELPTEDWDVFLHYVITGHELHRATGPD